MMFNSSHTGLCSKKYGLQCVLTLSALTQQKLGRPGLAGMPYTMSEKRLGPAHATLRLWW